MRKVKGRATRQDVEEGRFAAADQAGNDNNDENADKRIRRVGGKGLATAGKWIAERHGKYKKLMRIIQKMIATSTLAEKPERKKDMELRKATPG